MPAFDALRAYLEGKAAFTEDEFDFMRTVFLPMALRSGEFLQHAGEVARYAAFVAKGCLRGYVIDPKGKNTSCSLRRRSLADATSLAEGMPFQYFIDAIEDSDLLLIDPPSHQRAVDHISGYAASFRTGLQRHAAAKDRRIVNSLSASAGERYLEF